MSIQLGPEWQQLADRLQREPAQLEADMRRVLGQSLLYIERDARHLAPQDTRRLAGGINSRVTGTFPELVGVVGPTVQYGLFVERGRPAGRNMPPVNALMGWVRRHWHAAFIGPIPRGQLRPRRAVTRRAVPEREVRARAFLVARSIKRRADAGGRAATARPFMEPATRQNLPRIERAFARIGLRVVARLAGQPIQ